MSARVLEALAEVYDPELDEPITRLGFVTSCSIDPDGDVQITLRLPTPQCAPNFAFLMAADARAAVRGLPGVRGVSVRLEDHFTGAEINHALQNGDGFAGAFPGETTDDELDALRELFLRKALTARQSRLCQTLGAEDPLALRLGDLPDSEDARRCLELRRRLGLPLTPGSPAFVLPNGDPITDLARWLRTARLTRVSLETNGGICRSLLQARHGEVVR